MNIIQSNEEAISSLDFLDVINKFRIESDQQPIEPRKFIDKIEDELDDLSGKKFRININQSKSAYYYLTKDQMMLVGMRESKSVRKKVLEYLKTIESANQPAIPQNFAEALQLAADQAKQLELQAPKVAFVENLVECKNLMNAGQVGQKHGLSAVKLNKMLDELKVYNKSIKRARTFNQWFIDKGYGELKQTEQGYSQALFTPAGEVWINEQLISEGMV
jgi:phage antirepressor YoqD-like protein